MKKRAAQILKLASEHFEISQKLIVGKKRDEDLVGIRWAIIWVLLDELSDSVAAVARVLPLDRQLIAHVKRQRKNGIIKNAFLEKAYRAIKQIAGESNILN